MDGGRSGPEDVFLKFIRSEDFTEIRETFKELCLGKELWADIRFSQGVSGRYWVQGSAG